MDRSKEVKEETTEGEIRREVIMHVGKRWRGGDRIHSRMQWGREEKVIVVKINHRGHEEKDEGGTEDRVVKLADKERRCKSPRGESEGEHSSLVWPAVVRQATTSTLRSHHIPVAALDHTHTTTHVLRALHQQLTLKSTQYFTTHPHY